MLYELTMVLDGGATSAQKKAKQEFLEKLVKLNKGKIESSDDWGAHDLAYKIDKSTTGIFIYHELELDPAVVNGIKEKIKLEDGIIRYLMVKSDKKQDTKDE